MVLRRANSTRGACPAPSYRAQPRSPVAEVHEVVFGIHYVERGRGCLTSGISLTSVQKVPCPVHLKDKSRIPFWSLQIYSGVLIELATLANCYLFLPSALSKVSPLPRKPLFHKLPCMNSLQSQNTRVPCVVLQSDLPKPWHPSESGVRLTV